MRHSYCTLAFLFSRSSSEDWLALFKSRGRLWGDALRCFAIHCPLSDTQLPWEVARVPTNVSLQGRCIDLWTSDRSHVLGIHLGTQEKSTAILRAATQQYPRRVGRQIRPEAATQLQSSAQRQSIIVRPPRILFLEVCTN